MILWFGVCVFVGGCDCFFLLRVWLYESRVRLLVCWGFGFVLCFFFRLVGW